MELRQLRHFLSVLEHGSFSRAALELGISHQALSKSLAGLERELRVRLLDRGPRGVRPSTYGAALAKHAAFIITESRHAVLEMDALRGGISGHVTIGAGISSATEIVPRIAAQLLRRKSGLTVKVLTGSFDELKPRLLTGEIDVFIGTVLDSEIEPTLKKQILFSDEDRVVARADHPLVKKKRVKLSDLNKYPWIVSVGALPFRQALLDQFQAADLDPPPVAAESDSLEVTRSLLLKTDFLALLPQTAVSLHQEAGLIGAIDFSIPTWARTVSFCTRRRGSFAPATRLVLEEISKSFPHPSRALSKQNGTHAPDDALPEELLT